VVIYYLRFGTTYRSHSLGSELEFLYLRMGPIACLDTSVRNNHNSLRNNSEERSSQRFISALYRVAEWNTYICNNFTNCSSQKLLLKMPAPNSKGRMWRRATAESVMIKANKLRPTLHPLSAACTRYCCNRGNVPLMSVQGNVRVNSKHVFGMQMFQITGYIT